MNTQQLIGTLAQIHGTMMDISVRGDDAIRMAGVLTQMRSLVQKINESANQAAEEDKAE